MCRLPPDGPGPGQAEPRQIRLDRRGEFRPAAGDVDIFEAQQHRAVRPGHRAGEERAVGVAEMEQPGRAGGKARHRHDCGEG
jgi:hypothetical protein